VIVAVTIVYAVIVVLKGRSADSNGALSVWRLLRFRRIFSGTKDKDDDDRYSEEETARRRDEVIRRMISTPPRPHKEAAPGKSPAKHKRLQGNKPKGS
jgi:hypothetical protein